jgi:hypothetical protein
LIGLGSAKVKGAMIGISHFSFITRCKSYGLVVVVNSRQAETRRNIPTNEPGAARSVDAA